MTSCYNRKITAGICTVVVELAEKFSSILPENKDYYNPIMPLYGHLLRYDLFFLFGSSLGSEVLESPTMSRQMSQFLKAQLLLTGNRYFTLFCFSIVVDFKVLNCDVKQQ